jgi:flagellar hook-associated protein 3 FlgL
MRVSDSMMWSNMQSNVARRQADFAKAEQRAVTGKKVEVPSDDPAAFAQGRTELASIGRATNYERTIGLTRPVLEQTDASLYHTEDILRRIRDIAIQGANDTLNGSDKASLVQELSGLQDQLISIGNTSSGDRFIFAGYRDNAAPYDAAGAYAGDTEVQSVEISRNITMEFGVTGQDVFGSAGADVFTTISNLQTALTSSNGLAASAAITEIDTRYEQVRSVHSQIGIDLNALDISEAVVTKAKDTATTRRSNLIDIDAALAYTDLARAQNALNAAIQIAGQLPPPGLATRGG